MGLLQRILQQAYYTSSKLGLLRLQPFQWLFAHTYFIYKRHIEDDFSGFIKRHRRLFSGDVLDIGANIGYTSRLFSKVAKGKVFGFEPDPKNFEILKLMSKGKNIVPLQVAVGKKKGSLELWHNEFHHGDNRILTKKLSKDLNNYTKYTVPVLDIDSFVKKNKLKPTFVKIDVQGYELPVFEGMKELMKTNVVVAFEYQPEFAESLGFDPKKLLSFFTKRQFKLYLLGKGGKVRSITSGELDTIVAKKHYVDVICTREPLGKL